MTNNNSYDRTMHFVARRVQIISFFLAISLTSSIQVITLIKSNLAQFVVYCVGIGALFVDLIGALIFYAILYFRENFHQKAENYVDRHKNGVKRTIITGIILFTIGVTFIASIAVVIAVGYIPPF